MSSEAEEAEEAAEALRDAEEVLVGIVWFDCHFMFEADEWYAALAVLMAERAPA